MRSSSAMLSDASDIEHGCVDWFDYERHAKPTRGRPDRPREPGDCSRQQRRVGNAHIATPTSPAQPREP